MKIGIDFINHMAPCFLESNVVQFRKLTFISNEETKMIGLIIPLILIVLFIFIGPYFTIMALNTLFGLGIDVTFGTWFAMAWLHLALAPISKSTSSK